MIAKASAIQHGQAMTNYATKNNRADIIKTNHLKIFICLSICLIPVNSRFLSLLITKEHILTD